MRVNFHFHLDVEGSKILRFGHYEIADYKINDEYIVKLAYHNFRQLHKEYHYQDTVIEKVIFNKDKDITEEVNRIINLPLEERMKYT